VEEELAEKKTLAELWSREELVRKDTEIELLRSLVSDADKATLCAEQKKLEVPPSKILMRSVMCLYLES